MKFSVLATVILVSFAFANDAYDDASSVVPSDGFLNAAPGPVWFGPLAEMYTNGAWFNSAGTGSGGADESILETWGTIYGFGCQLNYDNLVADDFVVPSGETWDITSVTVAGYQTGSSTTPTINGMYIACYDDPPTTGTLVYGDLSTNAFSSAAWSGVYRVNEAGSGTTTNRPIMAVTADNATPWTLTEGTYWLVYQLNGSLSSGPWAPPLAIWGTQVTGNGLQSTDGGSTYVPVVNGGNGQGFLFILEGDLVPLQRSTWGSIKTEF
ncbi:MAG: hypothetical protein K8S15_04230 [Candidatus Aegiribacteria sp.]|nr:hypothetical protein [Candidatus Aegiribacteria sp.]